MAVRFLFFFFGGGGSQKSYVILRGGHAKGLRLMTRGGGGGSKIPKTCLRNTWMFPNMGRQKIKVVRSLRCVCQVAGISKRSDNFYFLIPHVTKNLEEKDGQRSIQQSFSA